MMMSEELSEENNYPNKFEDLVLNSTSSGIIYLGSRINQIKIESFMVGYEYANSTYKEENVVDIETSVYPRILEVIAMNDDIKYIRDKLDNLNDKLDARFDNLGLKIDKLTEKVGSINDTVTEVKTKLAATDKLIEKVDPLNDTVIGLKSKMDENDKWTEKFKIPIVVGLIIGAVNILPIIIKLFIVTPKP